MSKETADTIVKTWMERVWNQLDTSAIDELVTDDHMAYGVGDPIQGAAGWKEFHAAFSNAFADIQIDVQDQVVGDDQVASRWEGTAEHRASGTQVTMSGMVIIWLREGRAEVSWNSVDFLPMLMALGLTPEDAMGRALGGSQ